MARSMRMRTPRQSVSACHAPLPVSNAAFSAPGASSLHAPSTPPPLSPLRPLKHNSKRAFGSLKTAMLWPFAYFRNELMHALVAFCLVFGADATRAYLPATLVDTILAPAAAVFSLVFGPLTSSLPPPIAFALSYSAFCIAHLASVVLVCAVRRYFKPAAQLVSKIRANGPVHATPRWHTFTFCARDGVSLNVQVSLPIGTNGGDTAPTINEACGSVTVPADRPLMLLASPLGQCGPSSYDTITAYYGDAFTYVSWDYRGFFGTSLPEQPRHLSVADNARDALEVLRACGRAHCDVMIGHSMGTAVALELCLLAPRAVRSLVLFNSLHGQVFSTAFQPLIRFPFLGDLVATSVEQVLKFPRLLEYTRRFLIGYFQFSFTRHVRFPWFFESPYLTAIAGQRYMRDFINAYFEHICKSDSNIESYLRLFQELDAFSLYHLLPSIQQPTLLISGALDMLTPALSSLEMARRLPHAQHYCDPFSTHLSLLESPEWCLASVVAFLRELGISSL